MKRFTITALALLPTPAFAEVCDKERPNWTGTPATPLDEALHLFSLPITLALFAATALATLTRHKLGTLLTTALWLLLTTAILLRGDPITMMASIEGCIGQPTLFIAAVAAICLAANIQTLCRETRP